MDDVFNVVMVDDNTVDVMLMEVAFNSLSGLIKFKVISDGEEGNNYLINHHDEIDLIILDINLPGKNGLDILSDFRERVSNVFLPIVIFSTSNLPSEVKKAYKNGANAYIVKPEQHSDFEFLANGLHSFWHNKNLENKTA